MSAGTEVLPSEKSRAALAVSLLIRLNSRPRKTPTPGVNGSCFCFASSPTAKPVTGTPEEKKDSFGAWTAPEAPGRALPLRALHLPRLAVFAVEEASLALVPQLVPYSSMCAGKLSRIFSSAWTFLGAEGSFP
eukprot:6184257-Pleurochrysis_carterae.AAC.4